MKCRLQTNEFAAFILAVIFLPITSQGEAVIIDGFDSVPTNTSVTVRIQLWPIGEQSLSNLTVQTKCLSGSGAAVFFPSTNTVIGITITSYLELIGTVPSSGTNNMSLEVLSGVQVVASNLFTVLASPVITSSNAIDIARNATSISIPSGGPIGVVLSGGRYTVTFFTVMEPGLRQADYHAQVVLDAAVGTVIAVFSGP